MASLELAKEDGREAGTTDAVPLAIPHHENGWGEGD